MRISVLFLALVLQIQVFSQNVAVSNDGSSADPSSILELKTNDKGFLPPRMTQAERNLIASPAKGLIIYQTNGTEGLYINSGTSALPNWELLKKQEPVIAFSAYKTANQNINSGVYTKVVFETEDYDEGGNFSLVTSEFTVPSSGIYHFDISLNLFNNGGGHTAIFVNNVNRRVTYGNFNTTNGSGTVDLSCDLKLNAGDIVDVRTYFGNAGQVIAPGSPTFCWFNCRKL